MLATPLDDQRIGFSRWEETERGKGLNNGIPELPAGRLSLGSAASPSSPAKFRAELRGSFSGPLSLFIS